MLLNSLNFVPATAGDLGMLPWSVAFSPLAPGAFATVNGELSRCSECFGYVNPFATIHRHDATWVCSLCGHLGLLADHHASTRPELTNALVEAALPLDRFGSLGVPDVPVYLAVVDLTGDAAYVRAAQAGLHALVATLPPCCLFGLVTVDEHVGLHALSAAHPQVRLVRVPADGSPCDALATEVFALCQMLVPLEAHRMCITEAIDALTPLGGADARVAATFSSPAQQQQTPTQRAAVVGCGLGAALQFLLDSLEELYKSSDAMCCLSAGQNYRTTFLKRCTVRVVTILGSTPRFGLGGLIVESPPHVAAAATGAASPAPDAGIVLDMPPVQSTVEQASARLRPQTAFYHDLAARAATLQVVLDLFCLGDGHLDLASLRFMPALTGGQLGRWGADDYALVAPAMCAFALQGHSFHGLARLRVSHELRVGGHFGHVAVDAQHADILLLPGCDPTTTVLIDVAFSNGTTYDQGLFSTRPKTRPCMQMAFSYTTLDVNQQRLVRRLRLHTVSLSLARSRAQVIESLVPSVAFMSLLHKTTCIVWAEHNLGRAWQCLVDFLGWLLTFCAESHAPDDNGAPTDPRFVQFANLRRLQELIFAFLASPIISGPFIAPDVRVAMLTALVHGAPLAATQFNRLAAGAPALAGRTDPLNMLLHVESASVKDCGWSASMAELPGPVVHDVESFAQAVHEKYRRQGRE